MMSVSFVALSLLALAGNARISNSNSTLGNMQSSQIGYIQNAQDGHFLTCDNKLCKWELNPTQMFRKDQGDDGQWRYHIINSNGVDTRQCLDREHCHHGSSNARMSNCDHCGAKHWNYDGSQFAEDHMKNCIQSDGNIGHCSQAHVPIRYPVAANCQVDYQTITNLKCVSQNNDGSCGGDFIEKNVVGGHSETDCNACDAAPGSSLECDFVMGVTTYHTYTTTFSSSTGITIGTNIKWEAGFVITKAEFGINFEVSQTFTTGHTTTDTTAHAIQDACRGRIQAGTRESVTGNFVSGTILAKFTATVTTHWKDCPWKSPQVDTGATATMRITNVPTSVMLGSCTPVSTPCSAEEAGQEIAAPFQEMVAPNISG